MPARVLPAFSAALLVAALSAPPALACTFHQTNVGSFFEVTYPGSLNVAAATAQARSEGRLSKTPLGRGFFGYAKVAGSMKNLGDRFGSVHDAAKTDFFVILAGHQLWTEYRVDESADAKAYRVQVHAAAPQDGTPVVVISFDAVMALQAGALSAEEATDTGLLQIRGDATGRVAAVLHEAFLMKQAASR